MKNDPTERTQIYYEKDNALILEEERLAASTVPNATRTVLLTFRDHLQAAGSTQQYRIAKILLHLRVLYERAQATIEQPTKPGLVRTLAYINSAEWSEETKHDYRRIIRHFYRWYRDEDDRLKHPGTPGFMEAEACYRYLDRDIKNPKPRKTLGDHGVITPEECEQIIRDGCRSTLERAVVATLHNTGGRIGEILSLRIKDYQKRNGYSVIRLPDGKTGERVVPIRESIPHLERWMLDHPSREDPNALLFVSKDPAHYNRPLIHSGVLRLLQRVMERAGWIVVEYRHATANGKKSYWRHIVSRKKRYNPHSWRHSRITIWYQEGHAPADICKMAGHQIGSREARRYEHLAARDIENSYTRVHGLTPVTPRPATVQTCICGEPNTPAARYCFKCGQALSLRTAIDDDSKRAAAIEEFTRQFLNIAKDPGQMARFQELLEEERTKDKTAQKTGGVR